MILIVILFPSPRERKYYKDRSLWLTLFQDHRLSSLAQSVCFNRHIGEETAIQRKYQELSFCICHGNGAWDGWGILHPTNLQDASILKMEHMKISSSLVQACVNIFLCNRRNNRGNLWPRFPSFFRKDPLNLETNLHLFCLIRWP